MRLYKCVIIIFIIILLFFSQKVFAAETIDDVMNGADRFLEKGKTTDISEQELKSASDFIYNTLLGISMVAAVIIGMIIGIKYMLADAENKARYKETLVPYTISVIIMFGAFTIWKIVYNILS